MRSEDHSDCAGDEDWSPIDVKHPRKTFREYLDNTLHNVSTTLPDGTRVPLIQQLTRVLVIQALSGDTKAANLLLERIDPAPKQSIQVTTNVVTPDVVRNEVRDAMGRMMGVVLVPHDDTNGKSNGRSNGKCGH